MMGRPFPGFVPFAAKGLSAGASNSMRGLDCRGPEHVGLAQVSGVSRLFVFPWPSLIVCGLLGSASHCDPLTKNLYWTGRSKGTGTVTVQTPPAWVIASPCCHAPGR